MRISIMGWGKDGQGQEQEQFGIQLSLMDVRAMLPSIAKNQELEGISTHGA